MQDTVRKMKVTKIFPTECLLNNIIDKELQSALLPLNIIQFLCGICKYNISNSFITPNDWVSNIKCCFGAIVSVLIHFFRFFFFYFIMNTSISMSDSVYWVIFVDYILFSVGSVGLHIACILQSSNAVELIIKVQCFLNIDSDKNRFLSNFKISNYFHMASVLLFYVIFFAWTTLYNIYYMYGLIYFLLGLNLTVYDLDLVSAMRTLVLIRKALEEWNKEMALFVKSNLQEGASRKSTDFMLSVYADILKAFRLLCQVYQFSVTQYVVQNFVHILMNLQTLIEFGKSAKNDFEPQAIALRLLSACWNVKNVAYLALLCIECEKFYKKIKDAEYVCIEILRDNPSSEMRQTCKNVLRHGHLFQKMSLFGLFEVTAALPVLLLGSAVTYSVVLLQFAFL